jgi:hypothetical protein
LLYCRAVPVRHPDFRGADRARRAERNPTTIGREPGIAVEDRRARDRVEHARRLEPKQSLRVRIGFVLAVVGMAVAAVSYGEINDPVRPSPLTGDGAAGADATFPVFPELAAVRNATARFHDISSAYAAGYTTQFEPCVEAPGVGATGVHARNESLMRDPQLDPLRPELLLYAPQPNGGFRPTGVEYFQVVLLRNPATNEVTPWISPSPWPTNYEVVNPTP